MTIFSTGFVALYHIIINRLIHDARLIGFLTAILPQFNGSNIPFNVLQIAANPIKRPMRTALGQIARKTDHQSGGA
jgi:hypothetical protein